MSWDYTGYTSTQINDLVDNASEDDLWDQANLKRNLAAAKVSLAEADQNVADDIVHEALCRLKDEFETG